MKTAFFDCFGGATAPMLFAALLDAGAPFERIQEEIQSIPLSGFSLSFERAPHRGIHGGTVRIELNQEHPARFMREIAQIVLKGAFDPAIQERILRVFHRLAVAEGRVSGLLPDQVLFAQGAVPELISIAGVCLALAHLGISQVTASPLPLGRGWIETSRGRLPLPLPSVLELLRDVPAFDSGEEGERIDPAGAALLVTLARQFGRIPALTIQGQGYGIGSGMLRVVLGAVGEDTETETIGVLETNLDDTSPQFYEYILEKLSEAGALDVFLSPVVMKGGRQGVKLSALVPHERQQACTQVVFNETTSVGIRYYQAERQLLNREIHEVQTDFGPIRVRISRQMGSVVNLIPDYSDCLAIARTRGVPLKQVWQAAFAGAFSQGQLVP